MKVNRIALIDPKIGSIRISSSISKGIIAGIDFKIISENKSIIKEFKVDLSASSSFDKTIAIDTQLLKNANLVWNVVYCSKDVATQTGTFKIELFQELSRVKLNLPTDKKLVDIPICMFKKTLDFTDSLMFILRT
jgi:hypothetical protein